MKASLREAAERKAAMERELAELKAAEADERQQLENETRLSRKSAHNKSANSKKTTKARKTLEMLSDGSLSAVVDEEEQQENETRLSRKSGNSKKTTKAKKSLEMLSDKSLLPSEEKSIAKSTRSRNRIADTSQDSTLEQDESVGKSVKKKSFNKTKEIIPDTQTSAKKNVSEFNFLKQKFHRIN